MDIGGHVIARRIHIGGLVVTLPIAKQILIVVPTGFTDPNPDNNPDMVTALPMDNKLIFADSLEDI